MSSPSDDLGSDASLIRLSLTHPETFAGIFERQNLRVLQVGICVEALADDLAMVDRVELVAFPYKRVRL